MMSLIIKNNKRVDRVIVPLINTLSIIYQGNYLNDQELINEISIEMWNAFNWEYYWTKDMLDNNKIKRYFLVFENPLTLQAIP